MSTRQQSFFFSQQSVMQDIPAPNPAQPVASPLPPRFSETSGGVLPSSTMPAIAPQVTIVQPTQGASPDSGGDDACVTS